MQYRTYVRLLFGVIVALILTTTGAVIYGAPAYDAVSHTGYDGFGEGNHTVAYGLAVGIAEKSESGVDKGRRALRWSASGAATELGNLGTNPSGFTNATTTAVNVAGTAVGVADKYVSGVAKGNRPVRWDGASSVAVELSTLGVDVDGITYCWVSGLNNAGVAVGSADKYDPGVAARHPVRWDASGAATELGNLGTTADGFWHGEAYAINDSGTAVGEAHKYDAGVGLGVSAVRWDALGIATALGNLGTAGYGGTVTSAVAVNSAGTSVGFADKYVFGSLKGDRAVRWDASGTAATELANLGTDSSGTTYGEATDINDSNVVVGYAYKYDSGSSKGVRAVRWDASGAATELSILGTDSSGKTESYAFAINNAGIAVGYSEAYDLSGQHIGRRALAWEANGATIQLDTLLDPNSGWLNLTEARAISDTGWITGAGIFNPGGGESPYYRMFLIQIPESPTLPLLAMATLTLDLLWRIGPTRPS